MPGTDDASPVAVPRAVGRSKVAWRAVHGVLLIDKPSGITSTAALARARRVFRAEKGGHTGTLDPLASGLLPLCFGEATKFASDLLDADKSYRATLRLGVATDSGDSDGQVVDVRSVTVDRDAIERVVARFRGPIAQVPPMHSALKKDGQPLYKLARQGITVERAARNVTIHRLDVVAFDGTSLAIEVDCSKGTYIRTLAVDIGERLGCGAHLTALRRTGVADLVVADAVSLAALETMDVGQVESHLLPIDRLIDGLPRIDLDEDLARRFADGQRLAWATGPTTRVRVYRLGKDRTNDERTNGDRSNGDRSDGERSNGERSNGERSNGERSNGDRSNGERTNDERTSDDRTSDDRTSDERSDHGGNPDGVATLLGTGMLGGDGVLAPVRLVAQMPNRGAATT